MNEMTYTSKDCVEKTLGKVFFFRYKNSFCLSPLWCTSVTIDLEAGFISGWVENGAWSMTYYTDKKQIHVLETDKWIYTEPVWVGNAYDSTDYNDIIHQAEQRMRNGEPSEL